MIQDQLQTALAGRYQVERELGRGGMATVYLATDVRHDRRVAIKVLHPDLASTIGSERFEREIKLAAKLQHPHILGLIDSGTENGLFYYVMPFIEGESVRDKLDREKQLSVDEALQITLEVADALGYAHAQNIVHRDIKPENVMMSNGHALVADFGIARARNEAGQSKLTQTGMALGTPVYMSPEQATGEAVGPAADIYSLGCMLYEMLAGEPPFTGPNAMAIMAKHAMEMVPSIRITRPSVPEEMEEAILAAMEKSVADRPKTAADFCEILGTPLGATATRRITGRHTARHRVPTGAAMPRYQEPEALPPAPKPLYKRPAFIGVGSATLIAAAFGAWFFTKDASGGDVGTYSPTKIAVMYFGDRTDGELEHVADGITETLIDHLRKIDDLDVLSSDAVGRYRGALPPTDSLAKMFEAGIVVTGSVTQRGDRIHVSYDIVNGNTDASLENRGFDIAQDSLLDINKTAVDSVAFYLQRHVGEAVRTRELQSGTRNSRALALVQRAEKLRKDAVAAVASGDSVKAWNSFNEADSLLALAAEADEKWVAPLTRRAFVALHASRAAREVIQKAPYVTAGLLHVDRALALDPENLDALEVRGQLRKARWDLQVDKNAASDSLLAGAKADLEKVTTRDDTRAQAWIAKSQVEAQLRNPQDALFAAQRAYEADAYFTGAEGVVRALYTNYYDRQDFAKALQWCKDEGFKRYPNNWLFTSCQLTLRLAPSYSTENNIDSAWKELETLQRVLPANIRDLQTRRHKMFVAATIAKNGNGDSARRVIDAARTTDRTIDPNGNLLTAEALARVRLNTAADTAKAFELLKDYIVSQPQHGRGFPETTHWWWTGLRNDARWNSILRAAVPR